MYFEHLLSEDVIDEYDIDINRWVDDTDGMSIAHLKELFIAVCILGNPYDEAIETLHAMMEEHPKSSEDDYKDLGFKKATCGIRGGKSQ